MGCLFSRHSEDSIRLQKREDTDYTIPVWYPPAEHRPTPIEPLDF
jgi:hypothetical protein